MFLSIYYHFKNDNITNSTKLFFIFVEIQKNEYGTAK